MSFIWESCEIGNVLAGGSIILLCYFALFYIINKISKRTLPFIILGISFVLICLSFILNLTQALVVVSFVSTVLFVMTLIANVGDLRSFLANPFSKNAPKTLNTGVEKIYDKKSLYKTVDDAVRILSQRKVGALITFERNVGLKDVIKNGIAVNAPVSAALLETIFYNGTRLHDGAVVIHGNTILAAAVFYTPTTEPFAVKYGSRHRAAIGISEISDSITVVVSEETGRISLAINGTLETVEPHNFLKVFENYMEDNYDGTQGK